MSHQKEENSKAITLVAIIFGILMLSLVGCSDVKYINHTSDPEIKEIKVEYELELINQTHCKIHSLSSGKVYYVPIDAIQETLEFDNI